MKFCSNCGFQLEDDAIFCSNCGTSQEVNNEISDSAQPQQGYQQPQQGYQQPQQGYQQPQQGYQQPQQGYQQPRQGYQQPQQGYQQPQQGYQQPQQGYQQPQQGYQQPQQGYQQPQQGYQQPQQGYQQPQQGYQQPQQGYQQPVMKAPNPVEQGIINFCDRYCSPRSLTWSIVLCSVSMLLVILYIGNIVFNFKGVLADISIKLQDITTFWLVCDIFYLSILYLIMHLFNGLYKTGVRWPLLYITPCMWALTILLMAILNLTESIGYSEIGTLNNLYLASYICIGIIGIQCSKIQFFSWTGKVLIIWAICWIIQVITTNSNMVVFIFYLLSNIWLMWELNTRLKQFFHQYDYEYE